jgi:hypothetical protein
LSFDAEKTNLLAQAFADSKTEAARLCIEMALLGFREKKIIGIIEAFCALPNVAQASKDRLRKFIPFFVALGTSTYPMSELSQFGVKVGHTYIDDLEAPKI